MYADLSAGAVGVRATLEEAIKLAKDAGFKGVDFDLKEAEVYGPERARELAAANGLVVGAWGLPVDVRADEAKFHDGLKALGHWADVARKLGCGRCITWVLSGSNELQSAENFDFLRDRFRQVGMILKDYGSRLGLEFLGPKTIRAAFKYEFIHTLPGMLELCDAIGTGNMGVLLDCWHWHASGGTLAEIERMRQEQVVYVHVNDAPRGVPRDELIDNVRALPMETGIIDLPGFLKVLHKIGYDGPVAAEPFSKVLPTLPPAEAVGIAADGLKKAWRAAGIPW